MSARTVGKIAANYPIPAPLRLLAQKAKQAILAVSVWFSKRSGSVFLVGGYYTKIAATSVANFKFPLVNFIAQFHSGLAIATNRSGRAGKKLGWVAPASGPALERLPVFGVSGFSGSVL